MTLNRRDAIRAAVGMFAAAGLPAQAKPNSKFNGVQVGLNVPYSFHKMDETGDEILNQMIKLDLSAAELRSQPVEGFIGIPPEAVVPALPGRGKPAMTPEQEAARNKAIDELRKWRLAAPSGKIKEFRKKYEDAGVLIQVVKFDGIDKYTDDEIDYAFNMVKLLGANAMSCEIPLSQTKRLGEFAAKHKIMVGYHGHTNITSPEAFGKPSSWETAFTYSKYNGANIDLGHFTAANNVSPAAFLEKYTDRITHVHVKDRKFNNGPNVPFGQGDTPIRAILREMRDKKWKFQATIEFEYTVPEGSDTMTEIGKCVAYCKECLA